MPGNIPLRSFQDDLVWCMRIFILLSDGMLLSYILVQPRQLGTTQKTGMVELVELPLSIQLAPQRALAPTRRDLCLR